MRLIKKLFQVTLKQPLHSNKNNLQLPLSTTQAILSLSDLPIKKNYRTHWFISNESPMQKTYNHTNTFLTGSNFAARENVSDQLLIQREVRCQLIRVAFQYNRVGSAIEPGHVDGVARCGVGIDHIVNNHLTCLVFNHQFGLTDRLTPLNRHLCAKYRRE